MSRSIVLPVRLSDPLLRGFGAVRRRIELEGVRFKYSATDLGLAFDGVALGFDGALSGMFLGEVAFVLGEGHSQEQAASLVLIEKAAQRCGFSIELDRQAMYQAGGISLALTHSEGSAPLLDMDFCGMKALPPVSEGLGELFGIPAMAKQRDIEAAK